MGGGIGPGGALGVTSQALLASHGGKKQAVFGLLQGPGSKLEGSR